MFVILEAPEEEYDPRTLYQRLKEQRDKKDEEYEESRKLKNMIKGLDNEEISFLEMIDNNKIQIETQRIKEEVEAIDEFKRAVSHLNNEEQEKRLNQFKKEFFAKNTPNESTSNKAVKKSSQSALMANLVRKRTKSENNEEISPKKLKSEQKSEKNDYNLSENSDKSEMTVKCIGVLPGLGLYASDSSDSEDSSNSDNERAIDFNLIVRHKRKAPTQEVKIETNQSNQ